jgi:nucleoid DNA-binding protein
LTDRAESPTTTNQKRFPQMAKAPAKAPTKTQILANIAEQTELSKKDVAAVFDALTSEIAAAIGKGGPGQFAIPGLCKIVKKDVPAKPKRKGRNPADGTEIWLKPKPASKKLTIRPLKGLKEMI